MATRSEMPAGPHQVVILAAGRGSRLAPYTDSVPTALISIAGKPMVAHSIDALRRQGVRKFVVCRGWQADAFNTQLPNLGEGVTLVDCPDFATTGMLMSLKNAAPHLDPGGFYVAYGDIIYLPSVIRQLREVEAPISVVVNAAAPGNQSKGASDVEVVTTSGDGAARVVRRIGKNRRISEEEATGEFAGLVKFSAEGRALFDEASRRLWHESDSCTGAPAGYLLPWWIEPIQQASLCDLCQLLVDEGAGIRPAVIYQGWHEVNTPQDLTRAQNDTAMFLSAEDARSQVAAMGACLLSEANDLKRPLPIVAKELNISLTKIECLLKGNLEVSDALDVLRKMSEVYPVPLNDLWLDADDTTCGVRLYTSEAAEASARVLDRPDRTGERKPYYEYRDAAMSRCSQFRPEWIRELRIVRSGDPNDPDMAMNNGHLMMQTTLFIGPVDFYWKDDQGVVHRREMNTGDSNYISPFVPHSFTARDPDVEAIIIAVTYGGNVRRAFTEFSRVGATRVLSLAGDKRAPAEARRCVMRRHMEAECLLPAMLQAKVVEQIPAERFAELLEGHEGTLSELEALAAALNVRLSDLHVQPLVPDEEVVVTRAGDSRAAAREHRTYVFAPLARTPHQPDLKTFDVEVLEAAAPGEPLRCGLHTFVYHFGTTPVEMSWEGGGRSHTVKLRPGDSAYVAPMVEHRFSAGAGAAEADDGGCANPNGRAAAEGRRLFLVRIPGHLTGETLAEFATFSAFGRERVGRETLQWYN